MRCPSCVKDEMTSELHVKRVEPVAGTLQRYYDPDGNLHVHDETIYRDVFTCSNGHNWMVAQKSRCPCQIGCAWNETRQITAPPS
jgi:hypothetical protein